MKEFTDNNILDIRQTVCWQGEACFSVAMKCSGKGVFMDVF